MPIIAFLSSFSCLTCGIYVKQMQPSNLRKDSEGSYPNQASKEFYLSKPWLEVNFEKKLLCLPLLPKND